LLIIAQAIQLAFVKGFTETKDKIYSDSSQVINESVMNIRTVYSLGSEHLMCKRYEDKLVGIEEVIQNKSLFSGFMYGLSYLLQYSIVGLIFFMASVYVNNTSATS